jgi:hypothetical protein
VKPSVVIRAINCCRKALQGGLFKRVTLRFRHQDRPRGQPEFFWRLFIRMEDGCGRIDGGTRALELEADNREAAQGNSAISTSTIAHEVRLGIDGIVDIL